MSERDWILRYYRDGDDEGILDCLNAVFGRWPGVDIGVPPIDHLRWKLGPAVGGRRYHIIADAGGQTVACGLVRPCRVKLGDRIVPAVLYGDMAVLQAYQNRGIMGEVWDHQDEVGDIFALSIGISDNTFVAKEFDKRTRSRPLANRVEVFECATAPLRGETDERNLAVTTVRHFDRRVDSLWEKASRAFNFAMARDLEWLNYRYADPRAGRFTIRLAVEGDEVAGYAALTEARGKGFIADLLVLPGHEDALDLLLTDAIGFFATRNVDRVRCWLPAHHPYRTGVERNGFAFSRPVERLEPGPFGDTDMSFVFEDERAAVHYMAGDTDVV